MSTPAGPDRKGSLNGLPPILKGSTTMQHLYTPPGVYRHRPTAIQAIQWTPQTWPSVRMWLDSEIGRHRYHASPDHLVIETMEGDRDCFPGYWIVKEPADFSGFYCIRPQLFPHLYDEDKAGYLPKHSRACAS